MPFPATLLQTERGSLVVWTEGVLSRLPDADLISFIPLTQGSRPFEVPMKVAMKLAPDCFEIQQGYVLTRAWPAPTMLDSLRRWRAARARWERLAPFGYTLVPQGTWLSRLFTRTSSDKRTLRLYGENEWAGVLELNPPPVNRGESLIGTFSLLIDEAPHAFVQAFAARMQKNASLPRDRAVSMKGTWTRIIEKGVRTNHTYIPSPKGHEVLKLFLQEGSVELYLELAQHSDEHDTCRGWFAERSPEQREGLLATLTSASKSNGQITTRAFD